MKNNKNKKISVIPFAYQDIGYVALRELFRMGVNIPFVVTHRDNPKEKIWFRSVYKLAKRKGVPVFYFEDLSERRLKQRMRNANPDLLMSLYFRNMLKEDIFSIPKIGSVNLHGSYLPAYRGRCPVNWAILKGESFVGLTSHFIVTKPDAGDMIRRVKIPISENDTVIECYNKMTRHAPRLVRDTVNDFMSAKVKRIRQDRRKATYFGSRKPEDGRISWDDTARNIYNLVRSVTHPYPGAFTFLPGGRKVYIWKAMIIKDKELVRRAANFSYGQIVAMSKRYGMIVKTKSGILACLNLQAEGSREIHGCLFVKRYSLKKGTKLKKRS